MDKKLFRNILKILLHFTRVTRFCIFLEWLPVKKYKPKIRCMPSYDL